MGVSALTSTAHAQTRLPGAPVEDRNQNLIGLGTGHAWVNLYRPSNSHFYVVNADTGALTDVGLGLPGDIPVPANYDVETGAGVVQSTELAVFRPTNGHWYIRHSNGVVLDIGWGQNGDIPVPADYDNDGKIDVAVFRPTNGTWYIRYACCGGLVTSTIGFGQSGDVPVQADYDGDHFADLGVFRPSNHTWYIHSVHTGAITTTSYGNSGDVPVPADYDNDGTVDLAVYRPSNNTWYMHTASWDRATAFGAAGDTLIPGSWEPNVYPSTAPVPAVYRPSTRSFYVWPFGQIVAALGNPGDIPVP